jgi:hypothetical protein
MEMPVMRRILTKDYTTIPNALLQDQRLSCRDRGLLVWMLSKPQDWNFSKRGLQNELAFDGETAIRSAVKKLQETGYLKIERERTEQGKVTGAVWTVYDVPQL